MLKKSFFKKASLFLVIIVSAINVRTMDPNLVNEETVNKEGFIEYPDDLPPLETSSDSDSDSAPIPMGRTYAVVLTLRGLPYHRSPHGDDHYWNVHTKVKQEGPRIVYGHLPFVEGEDREMDAESFRSVLQRNEAHLEPFSRWTKYLDFSPVYEHVTRYGDRRGNRYWVAIAQNKKNIFNPPSKDLPGVPVQTLLGEGDDYPTLPVFNKNMRNTLRYGVFPGCQEIFRNPDFAFGPGREYIANSHWGYKKLGDGAK